MNNNKKVPISGDPSLPLGMTLNLWSWEEGSGVSYGVGHFWVIIQRIATSFLLYPHIYLSFRVPIAIGTRNPLNICIEIIIDSR